MLDGRVYRTAFLPALVALCVAAFALQDRPSPGRSALPADTFNKERAFGATDPEPQSLNGLAAAFPDRTPGSAGDRAMADFVARDLAAPVEEGERPVFSIRRVTDPDGLETVIATRPGPSTRRIVVLADRDARGLADLSATAALLELARVYKASDLRRTLELVSTTGASDGFAGAREWAERETGPIDGVIVLGDMAGTSIKKPWVVSWPLSAGSVPLGVQRTVQAAIRREVGSDAGGPRAVGQWVRRALPITLSEQGPIGARGLPAVLISETGELGPAPDEPVDVNRLGAFGRAAVRAVGGLDAAGRRDGPAFPTAPSGIITLRNVLPDWAARLIVGSALLPVLLASLDALFRARRRRVRIAPWISWLFVAAVPLPVAWLWLRMLGATGWIDGPSGPMPPDRWPLETSGIVAMVSALVAGALACVGARLIARALTARASEQAPRANGRTPPVPGVEGLAVATAVWLCAVVGLAWLRNPYAAGLLIPAAHLWLFAAGGWRGATAITALLLGLVVPVLAILHLAFALDLGPIEFAWGAALGAMAGAGAGTTLLLAGWLAAFASVIRVLIARRRLGPAGGSGESIRTRGPVSYAGPGSLGGTESALRR